MGQPSVNGKHQFEKIAVDGVVIWRAAGLPTAAGGQSLTIDLRGLLFIGKRLVVSNAR
jgi:hypothetical protein